MTYDPTNVTTMLMVDRKDLVMPWGTPADRTHTTLIGEDRIVVVEGDAVRLLDPETPATHLRTLVAAILALTPCEDAVTF